MLRLKATTISQSLLNKSEKELISHIKTLPAFHSCISEIALCSKEGGLLHQDSIALFAKSYTPVLRKVIFHLVSVIESLSFDEISEALGSNCATISICKMLASKTSEKDIPNNFFWTTSGGGLDETHIYTDAETKRKSAISYLLVIRILLSKLLLRPLETNLISRYNPTLAKNLRSTALYMFYLTFKASSPTGTPDVHGCIEFRKGLENVVEDVAPSAPSQVFDNKFLKLFKQLPKVVIDDAQQRIGNWMQAMFIDVKNSSI
jgi:hypothetical protein